MTVRIYSLCKQINDSILQNRQIGLMINDGLHARGVFTLGALGTRRLNGRSAA